jgi:hemoglobin-like flavoprotein
LNTQLILDSLDAASANGDPAAAVYARVFRDHPEMEKLFWRDKDGSVRGHMFQEMIMAIIDWLGDNTYGGNLFRIEHVNHEQLGVPRDVYPVVFDALRDEIRDRLKTGWTPETDQAWTQLLASIRAHLEG